MLLYLYRVLVFCPSLYVRSVSVNTINNLPESKTATAILAIYDSQNHLIYMEYDIKQSKIFQLAFVYL